VLYGEEARAMDMDNGHDGWCLLKDSWMFHRWYFHVYGRPTERGVYTHLLRQSRGKHDPEVIVAGIFRLTMRDGSSILVTARRGTTARLHTVLPPDWKIGDHVPWLRYPPSGARLGTNLRRVWNRPSCFPGLSRQPRHRSQRLSRSSVASRKSSPPTAKIPSWLRSSSSIADGVGDKGHGRSVNVN
jgi:hypothetical protein